MQRASLQAQLEATVSASVTKNRKSPSLCLQRETKSLAKKNLMKLVCRFRVCRVLLEKERAREGCQDFLQDGAQTTCLEYLKALIGPGRLEVLVDPAPITRGSEAARLVTEDLVQEFLWVHKKKTLARVVFIDPVSQVCVKLYFNLEKK